MLMKDRFRMVLAPQPILFSFLLICQNTSVNCLDALVCERVQGDQALLSEVTRQLWLVKPGVGLSYSLTVW